METSLKVNFSKNRLYGIGVDDKVTSRCARVISCRTDVFPSST